MKRLLLFSYILLPLLFSCEKEFLAPDTAAETLGEEQRTSNCTVYSFTAKEGNSTALGNALGETILVGFEDGMTLQARENVLKQHAQFEKVDGEIMMDSGIITRVKLKPNATCFDAEKLMKKLVKHSQVKFANPVFNPQPEQVGSIHWVGLSNEFLVSIEGTGTMAQLEELMSQTNTKLVFSLSEEIHVLSADKNSSGNALDMSNLFNGNSFIAMAEPNYIYQAPGIDNATGSTPTLLQKMEKIK